MPGWAVGGIVFDMLRWRLLLGPVLIAALAGIFWTDARFGTTSPILLVFSLVLIARATWELVSLLRTRSFAPQGWLVGLLSMAVMLANWWPGVDASGSLTGPLARMAPPLVVLVMAGMVLFGVRALRYSTPGANLETLSVEWLCVFYLGGLLSFLAQLRWVEVALDYLPLASVVVVAKVCDTSAFTAGKLIGGPKLVPALSPGKTWAGALGGVAGAALGAAVLFTLTAAWCSPTARVSVTASLAYGLIVGAASEMGDLCESLIKRDVGQKDSAPMLPGFGGLLDLLDSVLFAGPVAYLFWVFWPPVQP